MFYILNTYSIINNKPKNLTEVSIIHYINKRSDVKIITLHNYGKLYATFFAMKKLNQKID